MESLKKVVITYAPLLAVVMIGLAMHQAWVAPHITPKKV